MTLEDHIGDIVSKARRAAGVSAAAAARAAGLAEAELGQFEAAGRSGASVNLTRLAELLGLNPKKLEAIAAGWRPAPVDLSTWRELRQITTTEGMAVNCYLVWDEVTREAALFDTGWQAGPVVALVEEHGLQLKHIFITHTHRDHMAALGPLRERFPKAKLHSSSKNAPPEQRNRPADFIHLGSLRITHRDTPGHAEDGVTYLIGNFPDDAPNVAVAGDAIFAGSMGGAPDAAAQARQKIREQIFSLPGGTLICPGHGPLTTVAEEVAHNPFF